MKITFTKKIQGGCPTYGDYYIQDRFSGSDIYGHGSYVYALYRRIPSSAAADGESVSAEDDGQIIEIKRTSSPSAAELSEEFEAVWKLYPRKEGKEQARRAYVSARRSGVSADTIRAGIVAYNERIDREQIGMRYIVHGGNWFEGRRWEDEHPAVPPDGVKASRRTNNKALKYPQHQYSREALKAMGIDFGEDVYGEEIN